MCLLPEAINKCREESSLKPPGHSSTRYARGRALKNMKIKREFITPYITFLFLVIGLSGIFRFIHVFDDYTEIVHEFLGLAFVIFSALHIIINWKSLKIHFKKKMFVTSAIVVLLLSVGLIIQ